MLNVIDPTPDEASLVGPIVLGSAGVLTAFSGGAAIAMAFFIVGGAYIWGRSRKAAHARAVEEAKAWLGSVQSTIDKVAREDALPAVPAPVSLQSGEVCHWVARVEWREFRTETTRINYSGSSVSIPIAKGVRYRVGSVRPQRETSIELKPIDRGTLIITNKRVFFDGQQKNTTIRMTDLQAVKLSRELLILDKSAGKDPHIAVLEGDSSVLGAVVLAHLLAERATS